MRQQRLDPRRREKWRQAERHGGGVPHLGTGRIHQGGKALPAMLDRRRQGIPAGMRPGEIRVLVSRRRGNRAVLEGRSLAVANLIERRDHLAGKGACLLKDGLHQVEGEIAVEPLREGPVEAANVTHGEDHLGHRRAIGHVGPPEGVGLRLPLLTHRPARLKPCLTMRPCSWH
jgi:hypothetical protein